MHAVPLFIMMEWVGGSRPNSGAGHRVSDPKKSAEFLLCILKLQSDTELNGLDIDSLITEHIQVNKPSGSSGYSESSWMD